MSQVKKCFKSRFDGGFIVEADFSQLEVIYAAYVTGDKQLQQDLRDGLDMHSVNAAFMFNTTYDVIRQGYLDGCPDATKKRKLAKSKGFLIFYGGTAYGMAKGSTLTEGQCQTFIDNFFKRYPKVKEFQDNLFKYVNDNAVPTDVRFPNGHQRRKAQWQSPTGRIFTWYDFPVDKAWLNRKGIYSQFSRPQVCNYPVQGGATGDIVPMMCGEVLRMLQQEPELRDKFLMINTIHDSIVFDVHPDVFEYGCYLLRQVMEDVPHFANKWWGIDIDLPFKTDIEYGTNWLELELWE